MQRNIYLTPAQAAHRRRGMLLTNASTTLPIHLKREAKLRGLNLSGLLRKAVADEIARLQAEEELAPEFRNND